MLHVLTHTRTRTAGVDAKGRALWDRVTNVHALRVEFALNIRELTSNWNICACLVVFCIVRAHSLAHTQSFTHTHVYCRHCQLAQVLRVLPAPEWRCGNVSPSLCPHTHTHTHTHSLSLSLSLVSLSVSLSLSLPSLDASPSPRVLQLWYLLCQCLLARLLPWLLPVLLYAGESGSCIRHSLADLLTHANSALLTETARYDVFIVALCKSPHCNYSLTPLVPVNCGVICDRSLWARRSWVPMAASATDSPSGSSLFTMLSA